MKSKKNVNYNKNLSIKAGEKSVKQFNQDNMKSISDYINNFYEDNPFTKHLGVNIVSIDKGNVCVSLTIKHEHTNV